MESNLIYDVGVNNGDDTAYYLSKGYRVIGIEADPELCDRLHDRFRNEVLSGDVVLLNFGIAEDTGEQTFWINDENRELSSFDPAFATRFGGECRPVTVACERFADLLSQYGVPFYLKIDIEGADQLCLRDLDKSDLPNYVSTEAHSLVPLFQLFDLGYKDFKCLNQMFHNSPSQAVVDSPALVRAWREFIAQLKHDARSVAQRIPVVSTFWRIGRRTKRALHRERINSACAWRENGNGEFPPGSSGPFGEDTPCEWRSFEAVAYDWLHLKLGHPKRSTLRKPGWFDFHARLAPKDA